MNLLKKLCGGWAPWLLIAWTVFLWTSRLRNVLNDDDLTTTGLVIRIAIVVLFVVLAIWAGVGWLRNRRLPIMVLIVWSIGYWVIRGGGILIGDWSASFKIVHTVLMVVSLATSTLAWLEVRARSRR